MMDGKWKAVAICGIWAGAGLSAFASPDATFFAMLFACIATYGIARKGQWD
ncbi:hypothetical protein ACFL2D_02945 [Patescibacteria group bacterium]